MAINLPESAETDRLAIPFIREGTSLPIYWLNSEWAVTEVGMESLCEGSWYVIEADRLGQIRGDRAEWPAQMELKGWTDPRLFLEAFLKALEIHKVKYNPDLSQERALASKAADDIVAHREANRRLAARLPEKKGVYRMEDFADEDEIDAIKAEGFRAPEFPESCVDLGRDD